MLPAPPAPDPALVAGPLPAVHLDGDRVAVAAADRRGLLAAVAGCLALHRLDVLGADASTVDGRALVEFLGAAPLRRAAGPDRARQRPAPGGGRRRVGDPAAARPGAVARAGSGAPPRVVWHRDAATDAVVLELRAADSPALLYRVASALDEAGAAGAGGPDLHAGRATWWTRSTWSASGPATRAGAIEAAVLAAAPERSVSGYVRRRTPRCRSRSDAAAGSGRAASWGMEPVVCEKLTKRYGEVVAVQDLDLTVRAGRGLRLPRPQRRRQDDDAADAARPGPARPAGTGAAARPAARAT